MTMYIFPVRVLTSAVALCSKVKVAIIEEREEGLLRRRVKERNIHNIEFTKTRCVAQGNVALSGKSS